MLRHALLAFGLLFPWPALAQTDRTIDVGGVGILEITCENGSIEVRAWDRSTVQVRATHDPAVRVIIESSGRNVEVHAVTHGKKHSSVAYSVSVPRSMALQLQAVHAAITVDGAGSRVEANNVKGNVEIRGGRDYVEASSVEGSVVVVGARGRVEATSVNAGITLRDVSGPRVEATTVNGSVRLAEIDSRNVEATTVNGEVQYDGRIYSDGRYSFNSHNGALSISVPANTNADVSVSTFNGSFSAGFPVSFRQARGDKSFQFVLGSGGARLELQSFNGPIRLRRPGER